MLFCLNPNSAIYWLSALVLSLKLLSLGFSPAKWGHNEYSVALW